MQKVFRGTGEGVPENNVAVIRATQARKIREKSVWGGGSNVSITLYKQQSDITASRQLLYSLVNSFKCF